MLQISRGSWYSSVRKRHSSARSKDHLCRRTWATKARTEVFKTCVVVKSCLWVKLLSSSEGVWWGQVLQMSEQRWRPSFTQWSSLVRFRKTQHGTCSLRDIMEIYSMSSMFSPSDMWNRKKQVHVAFIYTADLLVAISDRQWLKYNHLLHWYFSTSQVPVTAPSLFIFLIPPLWCLFFLLSYTAFVFLFTKSNRGSV